MHKWVLRALVGALGLIVTAGAAATISLKATGPTKKAPAKVVKVVKACVNMRTGTVRVASKCRKGERRIVITGAAGKAGQPGVTGPQGPAGPKGDTGSQGSQGAKGDKGSTGATGATGAKGDQGIPGILSVTPVLPHSQDADSQCVMGGWLIATTSGDVLVCNGPEGAQGAKGDKGDKGDQGNQGNKGDKGAH
jgi:hypothetical protein